MHQQTVVVAQPQPVQVITTNPQPSPNVVVQTVPYQAPELIYATGQSLVLGVLQLVSGALAIIMNIVLIAINNDYYVASDSGYGIWCGVFFLVSGSLGIGASKNKQYGIIVGHMIMSIFSTIFAGILLIAASIGAAEQCNQLYYWAHGCNESTTLGLNIFLALLAVFEGVLAIWASVICCSATCCRTNYGQGRVVAATVNTTTTVHNAGQMGYYPQQPQYAVTNPGYVQQPQQYAYPQPQYIQTTVPGPTQPPPSYAANQPGNYPQKP